MSVHWSNTHRNGAEVLYSTFVISPGQHRIYAGVYVGLTGDYCSLSKLWSKLPLLMMASGVDSQCGWHL